MVTGAIFNSLIFGGVNSADYGIYITGEAVYNAPKRAVELIGVPGRNGDVALDLGHFENIEVTYPAGCYGDDKTDFRERISDFRNAVISQKGYQRLTDTYHPEEYRLGLYSEGLEVKPTMSKAGEFELVFNCKPQRYLVSGESAVTVANGDDMNNPTQFDAHPLLAVTGSGRVMFGDYTVAIYDQDLGTIDLGDQSNSRTTGSITTGDILVDASWLNNGDLATIGSTRLVLDTNLDMRYSNVVVDTRSGDLTIEAGASGVNKLALTVGATDIAFGSSAVSISGTADVRIVDKRTQAISRVTVQIQLMTYTSGYRRINATATVTPQTMTAPNITLSVSKWSIGIYNVSAYSTASALGNPTYIDCEIGEAYKYMGDKLMTLNGLVAFGNDLPSLPPGATEITKDPTITDLKITPRWWKI